MTDTLTTEQKLIIAQDEYIQFLNKEIAELQKIALAGKGLGYVSTFFKTKWDKEKEIRKLKALSMKSETITDPEMVQVRDWINSNLHKISTGEVQLPVKVHFWEPECVWEIKQSLMGEDKFICTKIVTLEDA